MRLVAFLLFFTWVTLVLMLFLGNSGVISVFQTQKKFEEQKQINQHILTQNQEMKQQIQALKHNPKYVEGYLRMHYKLIGKDEHFFETESATES